MTFGKAVSRLVRGPCLSPGWYTFASQNDVAAKGLRDQYTAAIADIYRWIENAPADALLPPMWPNSDESEDDNNARENISQDFTAAENDLRSVKEEEQVKVSLPEEVCSSHWLSRFDGVKEREIAVPYGRDMRDDLLNRFQRCASDPDLSREARIVAAAEFVKTKDYMSTCESYQ